MLTPAERYKLSTYNMTALLHETEQCRVELVVCSLNGCEYIKRSYHEDKRQIFDIIRRIRSPFIPQIYELFFDDDTIIIEEYVAGEKLDEIIARRELSARKLSRITDDLLCAIKTLHDNKIIHRDIKPENIIVAENGLKLIDYGIARLYKANEEHDTSQLGTRGYAAPEQYGFGQSGPRTDIYAFGKTVLALCDACGTKGAVKSAAAICARFDPQNRFPNAEAVQRYIRLRKGLLVLCICMLLLAALAAAYNLVLYGVQQLEDDTFRDIPENAVSVSPTPAQKVEEKVPSGDKARSKDMTAITGDVISKSKVSVKTSESKPAVEEKKTQEKIKATPLEASAVPGSYPETRAALTKTTFIGDITDGQREERVILLRKEVPSPALLLNWTNDRKPQRGTIDLGYGSVDVAASVTGDILNLELSDGKGNHAQHSFKLWIPIRRAYAGDMHCDAEVLFYDLDKNGDMEIIPAISERCRRFSSPEEIFLGYLTNSASTWCITYSPLKGFELLPEQLDTKAHPFYLSELCIEDKPRASGK